VCARSNPICVQGVWTRKVVWADRLVDSPVVVMVWFPGVAEAGIVTVWLNDPTVLVLALPRFAVSNVKSTTSWAPNPWPSREGVVVGGPTAGVTESDVEAAGEEPATGPRESEPVVASRSAVKARPQRAGRIRPVSVRTCGITV